MLTKAALSDYADLERLYDLTITTAADVKAVINDERYKRFDKPVDERFSRDTLIDLFDRVERRRQSPASTGGGFQLSKLSVAGATFGFASLLRSPAVHF
ncbi:MAG: hypothetical protein LBE16_08390, partial [Clostridiales Family XIII bacterium]|nr:hypothetical protein [Clostridiales Family XIII bacterium]